nr:MAG TPA_asm: hypothetical protein [Caudoviricetes sp.]
MSFIVPPRKAPEGRPERLIPPLRKSPTEAL